MSTVFHPLGDPEPEVTWCKGEDQIKPKKYDKRIKIDWDMAEDLNILIIKNATAADTGDYTVIAKNKRGTARFTVTVIVGKAAEVQITESVESSQTLTVTQEAGQVEESVVESATTIQISSTEEPAIEEVKDAPEEPEQEVTQEVKEEVVEVKVEVDESKQVESSAQEVSQEITLETEAAISTSEEVKEVEISASVEVAPEETEVTATIEEVAQEVVDTKEEVEVSAIVEEAKEEVEVSVTVEETKQEVEVTGTLDEIKPEETEVTKDIELSATATEEISAAVTEEVSATAIEEVSASVTEEVSAVVTEEVAKVEVPSGAPQMEIIPEPVIVDVDETICIRCKFSGEPNISHTWVLKTKHSWTYALNIICIA